MSISFISEVWDVLSEHIDLSDRSIAADAMINLLIDNNYEMDEIKNAFRGDKNIAAALKDYIREHEHEEETEQDEDSESEDYED